MEGTHEQTRRVRCQYDRGCDREYRKLLFERRLDHLFPGFHRSAPQIEQDLSRAGRVGNRGQHVEKPKRVELRTREEPLGKSRSSHVRGFPHPI